MTPRPVRAPFLAALLLLTLALALVPDAAAEQGAPTVDTPEGVDVPGTGAPAAEESLEGGPGIAYGTFLVLAVLGFAAALGYASWRYAKRPPGP